MTSDSRYSYPIMAGSKVIIRKEDKILFTREPLENEWMPGRLGLPGGKYLLHEGIREGTARKIEEETGLVCDVKGIFRFVQILMPEKTVYHLVLTADYVSGEIGKNKVYSAGLEWLDKEKISKLGIDDMTEYYYLNVLEEYFSNPDKLLSLESIIELRSFEDPKLIDWMRKGSK